MTNNIDWKGLGYFVAIVGTSWFIIIVGVKGFTGLIATLALASLGIFAGYHLAVRDFNRSDTLRR